jgi:putative spermidine/putrescine transport system ATP-binding protein
MAEPIVSFRGVEKTYDGKHAVLTDFNLDIRRGEFLTLLGPSGSGKTTTLMLLAGFEAPTAGDIFLNGRRINDVPSYKRNLGVVFQNYALFPHMTVAENLSYPLQARRLPPAKIREHLRRSLEMVRLSDLEERLPSQLSGGQQQRVAVARALVFAPDLVLMDEPLGALDRQLREQMQYEIKRIHTQIGVTVIYVTHDQGEALTMSNRIAVFNQGSIQQLGTPTEVYENPANSFVASFIGESNRLPGTIIRCEGETCAVRLDNGAIVSARRSPTVGELGKTTLSIRPERIIVGECALDNLLEGRVIELVYHGDHMRMRLDVAGNSEFIVKLPSRSPERFDAARPVKLGWHTQDCLALDPSR